MSIEWNIDHARRRVEAALRQGITEEEMYGFLGELIGEGAMPYAKLLDARQATHWIAAGRIGPIAATARLYSRMGLGPVGPLAIVVTSERADARAREYALLSDADRAVRVFDRRDAAEDWLATVAPDAPAAG